MGRLKLDHLVRLKYDAPAKEVPCMHAWGVLVEAGLT